MNITVDGHTYQVGAAPTLLETLQALGFPVPSLCHHPALASGGRCGLCVVAVEMIGSTTLELACQVTVVAGMRVWTATREVLRARSRVAKLLLGHAPFADQACERLLRNLVEDHDSVKITTTDNNQKSAAIITDTRDKRSAQGCLFCGLCVATCRKIGRNRLAWQGRGKNYRIGFVMSGDSAFSCTDCRACRQVCPSGFLSGDPQQVFSAGQA